MLHSTLVVETGFMISTIVFLCFVAYTICIEIKKFEEVFL